MKILLDAKTVTRLIDGEPPHLRERMDAAQASRAELVMSSLTLHDLAHAAMVSEDAARRLAQLDAFIAAVEVAPWTSEDALTAARIRADHQKTLGRPSPLAPTDLFYVAQALNNDWTVVSERPPLPFGFTIAPVLGLRVIDWSPPSGD